MKLVSRLLSLSLRRQSSRKTALQVSRSVERLESRRLLSVSLTPIPNATLAQGSAAQTLDLNQVFVDNTTQQQDLTFAARSDNSTVVQPTLNGNLLTVNIAPANSGIARLTIVASAPDGSQASQTLRIQVTASADRMLSIPIGPGRRTFRYVQADHTIGTITLSGPGSGTIVLGGDNLVLRGDHARGANQEIESITLTGTTAATTLLINGVGQKRGTILPIMGNITTDGSMGLIRIRKNILEGDLLVAGGVRKINIDGARNGTIQIAQSIGRINFTAGGFTDENFSTPSPINTMSTGGWASSDSVPEVFQAAYIRNLFSSSNFDVGVQLSGAGAPRLTLAHMRVSGVIGGTWNIPGATVALSFGGTTFDFNGTFTSVPSIHDFGSFSGTLNMPSLSRLQIGGNLVGALLNFTAPGITDLNQLKVRGRIQGSAIVAVGNIGSINAQALQQSIVYAGVAPLPQGQALPNSVADLSATSTIGAVTLHPPAKLLGFAASDIAAANIGRLVLGTTRVNNSGVMFGVAAQFLGFIQARDLTDRRFIVFRNVNDANTLAAEIAAQGLNLQDLVIKVLS